LSAVVALGAASPPAWMPQARPSRAAFGARRLGHHRARRRQSDPPPWSVLAAAPRRGRRRQRHGKHKGQGQGGVLVVYRCRLETGGGRQA